MASCCNLQLAIWNAAEVIAQIDQSHAAHMVLLHIQRIDADVVGKLVKGVVDLRKAATRVV